MILVMFLGGDWVGVLRGSFWLHQFSPPHTSPLCIFFSFSFLHVEERNPLASEGSCNSLPGYICFQTCTVLECLMKYLSLKHLLFWLLVIGLLCSDCLWKKLHLLCFRNMHDGPFLQTSLVWLWRPCCFGPCWFLLWCCWFIGFSVALTVVGSLVDADSPVTSFPVFYSVLLSKASPLSGHGGTCICPLWGNSSQDHSDILQFL